LGRYSYFTVPQVFVFNASLAWNYPISPLSPWVISSFLWAIKFTGRNVVKATLNVEYFMAHQWEGDISVLFSWLDLMKVTRDQVLIVDMKRKLGTETIRDDDRVWTAIDRWLPIKYAYLPPKATPHLPLEWSMWRSVSTAALFAMKAKGMGDADSQTCKRPCTPRIVITSNGKLYSIISYPAWLISTLTKIREEVKWAAYQIEN
jgi:hypothetical protein